MPSRRFRKDGREALKLSTGGGGVRINTLSAPAVAKQTKPGDSLEVQVEPVVPRSRIFFSACPAFGDDRGGPPGLATV